MPDYVKRYDINKEEASFKEAVLNFQKEEIEEWYESLIEKITALDCKHFKFKSNTTQVRFHIERLIKSFKNSEYDHQDAKEITKRLSGIEKEKNEEFRKFHGIQEGSLFLIIREDEDKNQLVLAKIDHSSVIDDRSNVTSGVPKTPSVYKACIVTYITKPDFDIISVYIGDKGQSKVAKFWRDDFLECIQITNDEASTKNAFHEVEKKIRKYTRNSNNKNFDIDKYLLRNNLSTYFKTHEVYKHSEMIDFVVTQYKPENVELKKEELIKELSELPVKLKGTSQYFDLSFSIVDKELKTLRKTVYHIDKDIDLTIKNGFEDKEKITKVSDSTGKPCLLIKDVSSIDDFPIGNIKLVEETK
ncbi:MAG: hypothetical protein JXK07_10085 [Spirochaetes bacterium]|nr:hypothetical protein [Spirochaetota bacterium]MBN2771253.1 hypothetical protein [Spirochaetota bacterium]